MTGRERIAGVNCDATPIRGGFARRVERRISEAHRYPLIGEAAVYSRQGGLLMSSMVVQRYPHDIDGPGPWRVTVVYMVQRGLTTDVGLATDVEWEA